MRKIQIHDFKSFALNEVKGEAVKKTSIKVTKEFETNLQQLVAVVDEIEKLDHQIKTLKKTSEGLEKWIKDEMQGKYGASLIRVNKIIVAIQQQKGRVSPSYKGMVDDMSTVIRGLVKDMSKAAGIITEIMEKHTPEAKIKDEVHFAVEESLSKWTKDKIADLKAWLTKQFNKLKPIFSSIDSKATKLEKILGIASVKEGYEMNLEDTDSIDVEYAKTAIVNALEKHSQDHGSNMSYKIDVYGALLDVLKDEGAMEHGPIVAAAVKEVCTALFEAAKKLAPADFDMEQKIANKPSDDGEE